MKEVRIVLWQKNRGDGSLVSIGGAFTLTDTKGERFTEADLKGKPYAMFFGFTHCPDVCPTTLWEMTTHLKALGDDGDRLNMVFVGVDHERDTPEHLGTYLSAFDDRIIGLSGTEEQIARMAKTYRIFFERVEDASGDILYNHSAQVLLFKANGQFKSTIAYEERAETAFEKLKLLVD